MTVNVELIWAYSKLPYKIIEQILNYYLIIVCKPFAQF